MKDWKAKLESAYSFMLKYSEITVCTNFSLLGYLILSYILFINMFCCTTNTCVLALLQKGGKRGNVKCKILLQKALEEN